MEIGKNLRKIRESKKLTQQYVADYVGVERKTYINWETGESDVKSKFIPMLAELFNVEYLTNVVLTESKTKRFC